MRRADIRRRFGVACGGGRAGGGDAGGGGEGGGETIVDEAARRAAMETRRGGDGDADSIGGEATA